MTEKYYSIKISAYLESEHKAHEMRQLILTRKRPALNDLLLLHMVQSAKHTDTLGKSFVSIQDTAATSVLLLLAFLFLYKDALVVKP